MAMDDPHCCYCWSYIRKKSKKRMTMFVDDQQLACEEKEDEKELCIGRGEQVCSFFKLGGKVR